MTAVKEIQGGVVQHQVLIVLQRAKPACLSAEEIAAEIEKSTGVPTFDAKIYAAISGMKKFQRRYWVREIRQRAGEPKRWEITVKGTNALEQLNTTDPGVFERHQ